jgi:hypothetical protein
LNLSVGVERVRRRPPDGHGRCAGASPLSVRWTAALLVGLALTQVSLLAPSTSLASAPDLGRLETWDLSVEIAVAGAPAAAVPILARHNQERLR